MPVLGTPVADSSWIPTFSRTESRPVKYCALVSEGGGPYRVFLATIASGSGGQYDHGNIESIEGAPVGASPKGKAGVGAAEPPASTTERCRSRGYSDFALAQ